MSEQPTTEIDSQGALEPCPECGSPLASDQRYCLNCGRRRGEARIDYAQLLGANPPGGSKPSLTRTAPTAPAAAIAAAPQAAPANLAVREPSPFVAVAGIALLGLTLLVGVLIGRGDGGTETAAAPTVLRVEDGAGSAGTSASGGDAANEAAGGADSKDAKAGGGDGGGGAKSGGDGAAITGPAGTGAGTTESPEVADLGELEALENATGEEQQEASENLPDTIAIPGEPPPTDNQEPGGGTDATVIE